MKYVRTARSPRLPGYPLTVYDTITTAQQVGSLPPGTTGTLMCVPTKTVEVAWDLPLGRAVTDVINVSDVDLQ